MSSKLTFKKVKIPLSGISFQIPIKLKTFLCQTNKEHSHRTHIQWFTHSLSSQACLHGSVLMISDVGSSK